MSGSPPLSHLQTTKHKPVQSTSLDDDDGKSHGPPVTEQEAKTKVPSPIDRPLSPSALLQQQKLRSKHHFLSPQFDTSCLPEAMEMEKSALASGSGQERCQPTISVAHPSEPGGSGLTTFGAVAPSSYTRSHSSQSVSENGNRTNFGNVVTIESFPSPPQVPTNSIKYRNLGKSGLKIPILGLSVWHSFSAQLNEQSAESIIKAAFQCGINFFDTGDAFNEGRSETLLGNVIKRNRWPRSDFIVATKLFWNCPQNSNNGRQGTLSRKFLTEALQASLQRLQLSYVDLVIVNRLDGRCPMEEIVRTMHWLVERGFALYWGTSRWSASHLAEAFSVARQFNCVPPACEQMEYSLGCSRRKCETAMSELYHRLGVGVLSWSVNSLDADFGIQLISRRSITDYQTYGLLGPPESNPPDTDRCTSAGDISAVGSSSAETGIPRPTSSKLTLEASDASGDQRKLSGVSMKLSRKSSTMDKKKMSSVERQLIETANLNVERLNDDRLQIVDRLQIDRLSVDRLSASSALSTPEKSPFSPRRRTVDRTLSSGSANLTPGPLSFERAGSVCGSELGKSAEPDQSERQTRFDAFCAKIGCDPSQFSIAWSLRNEQVNCVLISPKSIEQLYSFINSLKFTFQLKQNVLDELERILTSKPDRKGSALGTEPANEILATSSTSALPPVSSSLSVTGENTKSDPINKSPTAV